MKWPEFNLSKLTKQFISGGTPSTKNQEYWSGDIPWITGADFLDGEVVIGRRYINKNAVNNSATHIVPVGSILMVTRTSVGKIAIAPVDIAISQDITGIIPRQVVNSKFLVSAIRQRMDIILAAQRGATIKGVTRDDIKQLSIPLLPLSEQRRIVEILDQADALRKKRAEADAKASSILPALFYKMFGDPIANPQGWPTENLGNLLLLLRNGTTTDQNQEGLGYPVTRIETISAGIIDPCRVRYVVLEKREIEKWRMQPGDILFSHINSESHIGKTAIYEGMPEILIHGMNLLLMRPNPDRVLSQYIFALLNTESVRAIYQQRCKRAVNQASLNQKDISSLTVAVAPVELQERFCQMTEILLVQIRHQKCTTSRIDTLFDNLLYRAFTGDLTAKWREAHMKELLEEMEQQARELELRKNL